MKYKLLFFAAYLVCPLFTNGDVLSYLRFEEGSGYGAWDETGLMNGELLGFSDVSPGTGDTLGLGWSTNVACSIIPLTGELNSGSIRYAGGGEYIDLSNANTLDLGEEFTVEMYFCVENLAYSRTMFGLSPFNEIYYNMGSLDGENYFNGQFQDELFGNRIAAPAVQEDQWYHFALIKEVGKYSVYIDGQLLGTVSLPSSTDGPYTFPGTAITGDRYIGKGWSGWLDEVRFSDEALTPDQFLCAVPEPSTLIFFIGGLWLIFYHRRSRG